AEPDTRRTAGVHRLSQATLDEFGGVQEGVYRRVEGGRIVGRPGNRDRREQRAGADNSGNGSKPGCNLAVFTCVTALAGVAQQPSQLGQARWSDARASGEGIAVWKERSYLGRRQAGEDRPPRR